MKNIAVIGMGKVGSLVGSLLSDLFNVTGFDQRKPFEDLPFEVVDGDISDTNRLKKILDDKDAVVSCLPYHLNLSVARCAQAKFRQFLLCHSKAVAVVIQKV